MTKLAVISNFVFFIFFSESNTAPHHVSALWGQPFKSTDQNSARKLMECCRCVALEDTCAVGSTEGCSGERKIEQARLHLGGGGGGGGGGIFCQPLKPCSHLEINAINIF